MFITLHYDIDHDISITTFLMTSWHSIVQLYIYDILYCDILYDLFMTYSTKTFLIKSSWHIMFAMTLFMTVASQAIYNTIPDICVTYYDIYIYLKTFNFIFMMNYYLTLVLP